jgi:hypothetical protein
MFNAGGTISTLNVSAIQQDLNWKAYVGNITGSLTLDDADNKTIYDWSFTTLTGEIYASRASSVTFTAANCSLTGNTSAEETALGFVSADSDNLARTFNQSTHTWFLTGINNMTGCNSTSTYVNDVRQAALPAADFQEAVLSDGINIIYASVFETDAVGYDDPATYDFQMIVPQNKSTLTGTTYYFWVELG